MRSTREGVEYRTGMKQKQIVTVFRLMGIALALWANGNATPPSQWMSGRWGIGFRIDADSKTRIANYSVETLVSQVQAIEGLEYVLFNLSDAAHGDAYLAPHSVLSVLNPKATPNGNRDLFMELAQGFHNAGIKVIAYVATQGPAMLKHGAEKAFDSKLESNGEYTSQAMNKWSNYVASVYGDTSVDRYKQAFAEVIIEEYAQRYGELIDGWWFDHAGLGNIPLLHKTVTTYNPNTIIAFNTGQKVPLTNNCPDYEDYTAGHPTPVARHPASSHVNLPMLESIEATPNGFFEDTGGDSLGHLFMPLQTAWNSGEIVWTISQAAEWQQRVLDAGGAWTWNLETEDENSRLNTNSVAFIQRVLAEQGNSNPIFDGRIEFDNLQGNIGTLFQIDGKDARNLAISVSKRSDEHDLVYSFEYSHQDFDGEGVPNDSLSWDLRVSGRTNQTNFVSGTHSVGTGDASSAIVEGSGIEFGVAGIHTNRLDAGESLTFCVENIALSAAAGYCAEFSGFDGLWMSAGSYLVNTETSEVSSLVVSVDDHQELSPVRELHITSIEDHARICDLDGSFTILRTPPFLQGLRLGWINHAGTVYPGVEYTRRTDPSIAYIVEATTNLVSPWTVCNYGDAETNLTEWSVSPNPSNGTETIWVKMNQCTADTTSLFIRVRATH